MRLDATSEQAAAGEEVAELAGRIVAEHAGDRGGLIAVLGAVQSALGYLPEAALRAVAERMGVSLVDVYGVATFYRGFSLEPRGRHVVSCCLGTACHVRGAPMVVEEFARQLGIAPGETTADREFSLETVNCLGACALGPMVVVDGRYFSNVRKPQVAEIVAKARQGLTAADLEADDYLFPVQVRCPLCNHSLMDPQRPSDDLPSIRVTAGLDGQHAGLNLSSRYGSHGTACEASIPGGSLLSFFCPHCHGELLGRATCVECGAPMAPMMVEGGGVLQVCTRRACTGHRLDLNGANG